MSVYIKVKNHNDNPINLTHLGSGAIELRPIELHFNTNGTTENKPTFAIVLEHPDFPLQVYGQFSLNTLQDCLSELGMQITKQDE